MSTYLESALRDSLAHEADVLDLPDDPFEGFTHRERRHRRGRRLRVAALAAVAAAALGVQTNIIPLPDGTPGFTTASVTTPLARAATRGSLAGDAAWLAGFRAQIKDLSDPDGLWKVADRSRIRIIYAGDVGTFRVALAVVPLRLGAVQEWDLIWYEGPAGAAPARMTFSANASATDAYASWSRSKQDGTGMAVFVGPPDVAVTMSAVTGYAADGTLRRRPLSATTDDGVAFGELPPEGTVLAATVRATRRGTVVHEEEFGSYVGGFRDGPVTADDPLLKGVTDGMRGPVPGAETVRTFVDAALEQARLAHRGTTARLLWSGPVNGRTAGLVTLQSRGGGVVAVAVRDGDRTSNQADGGRLAYIVDQSLLVPAKDADRRPYAWRLRADGERRTDQVVVVAPGGAKTVTIRVDGGRAVPVTLDASGRGTATVPPEQDAVVTAVDAGGRTMARTPVPRFETVSGGVPGSTPGTRIVG